MGMAPTSTTPLLQAKELQSGVTVLRLQSIFATRLDILMFNLLL